jgi:acid phosphatase (class A)
MNRTAFISVFFFSVLICFQDVALAGNSFAYHSALGFLSDEDIAMTSDLSSPPGAGSKVDREDMNEVLRLQKSRTAEDCKRITYELQVSLATLFGPKYGPLSSQEVAKLSPLFEKVRIDVVNVALSAKKRWHRVRPYVARADIRPCLTKDEESSYPSGHATTVGVFVRILELLDPGRKAAFEERADTIGKDRVLDGAHYPSDIEAGRQLGEKLFSILSRNRFFKVEVEKFQLRSP